MYLTEDNITLHLDAYKCEKCGRERLNGDQAMKLDQMMLMIDARKTRVMFEFERAAN